MGFFDWNKDAERRLLQLTNNFEKKVKVMKYNFKNTSRIYLEIVEVGEKNIIRFSIYEDEIQSVLDYLSQKYNEKIILSPKRNEIKKSK